MGSFNSKKYTVSASKPFPIILLLDVSGSMNSSVSQNTTRISELNLAVEAFLETLKKEMEFTYQVSIITFGTEVNLHVPPTEVNSITWQPLRASGLTPLAQALEMTHDLIGDYSQVPKRCYKPTIILLSDGAPNGKPWRSPMNVLKSEGRSQHCDRIAIGVGPEAFEGDAKEVLKEFIKGSHYNVVFEAVDAAHLSKIFDQVTMTIIEKSSRLSSVIDSKQPRRAAPRIAQPKLQRTSRTIVEEETSSEEDSSEG